MIDKSKFYDYIFGDQIDLEEEVSLMDLLPSDSGEPLPLPDDLPNEPQNDYYFPTYSASTFGSSTSQFFESFSPQDPISFSFNSFAGAPQYNRSPLSQTLFKNFIKGGSEEQILTVAEMEFGNTSTAHLAIDANDFSYRNGEFSADTIVSGTLKGFATENQETHFINVAPVVFQGPPDTADPLIKLTFNQKVFSFNAPDHSFETAASGAYFSVSDGTNVQTTSDMGVASGVDEMFFSAQGEVDITSSEGMNMLGLRANGTTQAVIEEALGVAAGTFDTIDPDGVGPKGALDVIDGSYAQTAFYVNAGDVLKFDWNLISQQTAFEEVTDDDVAYVVINGIVTELARSSDVPGAGASGWQTFSYTATQEGPLEVSFAVFNVSNNMLDAGLALDNFTINDAPVQKQAVALDINLTVTDETAIDSSGVVITISGLDATSALSAGTDMGGGIWTLGIADLEGLTMTPPDAGGAGYTGTETLTIRVDATDSAGNLTTVTGTQEVHFNVLDYTNLGSTIADGLVADGNDNTYLSGRDGDETLSASGTSYIINGGDGNDSVGALFTLGTGKFIVIGGKGNDELRSHAGTDVFLFLDGDEGTLLTPATDTVQNFRDAQDDYIDLTDLLNGESHETLTDYLFVEYDGMDSTLYINTEGNVDGSAGHNADQIIVLESFNAVGGAATQSEIIGTLIDTNIIVTDSIDTVGVV